MIKKTVCSFSARALASTTCASASYSCHLPAEIWGNESNHELNNVWGCAGVRVCGCAGVRVCGG